MGGRYSCMRMLMENDATIWSGPFGPAFAFFLIRNPVGVQIIMDMHRRLALFQEYHCVSRRLVAFGYHFDGVEIKGHLMIDTA